jgi:hypothetical protein
MQDDRYKCSKKKLENIFSFLAKKTWKTLITKLVKIMKTKGQNLHEKYWVPCSHITIKSLQTTKFQDLQFVSNEKKK